MERSRDWIASAVADLEHARSDRLNAEGWGHSTADLLVELGKHHDLLSKI
jgi:hypothetical protein